MSERAPFSLIYNLNRLGQAGDEIAFSAKGEEREALARLAGVVEVPKFEGRVGLKKISPTRFGLAYALVAEVIQACVVTLEPLRAAIVRDFSRELHYSPRRSGPDEVVIDAEDEEAPEEIGNLHYDLAGPLIEEFLLAIDPYPRAPGVEFHPPESAQSAPENPFAALKGLKSGE